MAEKPNVKLRSPDYVFLSIVLVLLSVGLIMIFSASPTMGLRLGDSYFYVKRHIFYLLLGLLALYMGFNTDYQKLKKFSFPLLLASFGLLILAHVPGIGVKISGATRWINFYIFTLQPSEITKFAMVLFLASYFSNKKKDEILNFSRGLLPPLLIVLTFAVLIIKEPDMGTAMIIIGISFVMFFMAGARLVHLGSLGLIGILAMGMLTVVAPYRMQRIVAFLDPWKDPRGTGFQIIQSLLAVGSGGLWGMGLGGSRQKYFYLPQQFTDFVFAILCEEMGFIGGVAILLLFAFFAFRGLNIARNIKDEFGSLVVAGVVSWVAVQAFVNIAVVIGLLPTTGLPLPFISYGGTSMVVLLYAIGVVLNISRFQGNKSR